MLLSIYKLKIISNNLTIKKFE